MPWLRCWGTNIGRWETSGVAEPKTSMPWNPGFSAPGWAWSAGARSRQVRDRVWSRRLWGRMRCLLDRAWDRPSALPCSLSDRDVVRVGLGEVAHRRRREGGEDVEDALPADGA